MSSISSAMGFRKAKKATEEVKQKGTGNTIDTRARTDASPMGFVRQITGGPRQLTEEVKEEPKHKKKLSDRVGGYFKSDKRWFNKVLKSQKSSQNDSNFGSNDP